MKLSIKRKKKELPKLEISPYFTNPHQYLIDKGIVQTQLIKHSNYTKEVNYD